MPHQEGYGECPFLSAEMVRTYIRGIQGPPDAKYLKIATDSKHLAVHTGPESPNNARRENRLGFDSVVSQRAIYEHFLPPFRAAAEAGTSSFMCSCACDHHHHHQQLLRLSLVPGSDSRLLGVSHARRQRHQRRPVVRKPLAADVYRSRLLEPQRHDDPERLRHAHLYD